MMSWCVKKIGKRGAVLEEIAKDQSLPAPIREAIVSVLQDEPRALNGVRVEGGGHTCVGEGSANSNIYKLEVEPIALVE